MAVHKPRTQNNHREDKGICKIYFVCVHNSRLPIVDVKIERPTRLYYVSMFDLRM